MTPIVVGLFVGGQSRRMGSPKGLLKAPDGDWTLLARLCSITRAALPEARIVLMGEREDYSGFSCRQVPDAVEAAGPVGGLLSLVRATRQDRATRALALACDMPYVSRELVRRLAHACPNQANLAARVDGRWQPFFARYEPMSTEAAILALVERGRFGMTEVLTALAAGVLPITPSEARQLGDWDTPADVGSSGGHP